MNNTTGGLMRVEKSYKTLTPSGKKIADYILDNAKDVITMTTGDLGEMSKTSASAVIRFCKMLEVDSFQDLKIRIAGDLQSSSNVKGFKEINPNETFESIIDKMTNNSVQTLYESANLIDVQQLREASLSLNNAKRIHFVGVGASNIIAKDAEQKFQRINKDAYSFEDMHMATTFIANASMNDVVVGISYSGETSEIIKILKLANSRNAKTISITKFGSRHVAQVADINLYLSATKEPSFRSGATSSRIAQLHLIDILFMCVASLDYENAVDYIEITKEAIDNIQKSSD